MVYTFFSRNRLETGRIESLADSCPLWYLCSTLAYVQPPLVARRTVYSLPISLDFAVKDCVFILWQHLLLRWHFQLPPLHLLHALSLACERIIERLDYGVDVAEALTLSVLLVSGQAPWNLPT
jgi:hypothetical protein